MDNNKKTIILYGSVGLKTNMGDQAMIFTFADYFLKNENVNVFLLNDIRESEREKYGFNVIQDIPLKHMIKEINLLLGLCYQLITFNKKYDENSIKETINIFKKSDLLFCLNGFLLSSQMSFANTIGSMIKILYAKKFGKRLIVLPQSVGPFDYKGIKKFIFNLLFKKAMTYPEIIYLREEAGYQLMKERNLKNIALEHDLVLSRSSDINLSRILKKIPEAIDFSQFEIDNTKDILVNPNFRFLKYEKEQDVVDFFSQIIIQYLNYSEGKAYLFAHDYIMDRDLCEKIYEKVKNNDKVIYIREEFYCTEIEQFFSLFNIGVVSRWHALVHSIRAILPAVVLGWSEKYRETARLFEIEENLIDIRDGLDVKKVIDCLIRVKNNRKILEDKICEKHDKIKKTFVLERKGELWLK
ncbi:MAG: polysaccharide pyruvyl transferase family protein [Clostridia bacterium]|nr:polysaccharide pyruvyl transferase family protein [Clostridia bacterium]